MTEVAKQIAGLSPLQRAVYALKQSQHRLQDLERARVEPIAVVGMGCRFPGGIEGPRDLWHFLIERRDAIGNVPSTRWDVDGYFDPRPGAEGKMYNRSAGLLTDITCFDPELFNLSPKEAKSIDPQHRLLLEVTWRALEHAGIAFRSVMGKRVGIFVGQSTHDFSLLLAKSGQGADPHYGTGTCYSAASGRLAYFLGTRGPCMTVDTACSSSLVGISLATRSLRNGESELAIAGGANAILSPENDVFFCQIGGLAADGRCKSFDARADGYVRAEGAAVVVLKRLSDALRDGDQVWAVLRGTAVSHDGRSNGFTAPSGIAQQEVVRAALAEAGMRHDDVDYVETHGSGTPLGDPIEAHALSEIFKGRPDDCKVRLGAVKTNLGHLEAAAGVAGFIKAVLAVHHGQLPGNLHFERPNEHIPFDTLPLSVQRETTPWPHSRERRTAGVSSFGITGTNAHVVLESSPARPEPTPGPMGPLVLQFAAKTATALTKRAAELAQWLSEGEGRDARLCDVVHTLRRRGEDFQHRLAAVFSDRDELCDNLRAVARGEMRRGIATGNVGLRRPRTVFVFPGQGTQWADMGRDLYRSDARFRAKTQECAEAIREIAGWDPLPFFEHGEPNWLDDLARVQPLLFTLQTALAEALAGYRITPDSVVGHSMGEIAAAHVAGALSLADAAKVVCVRSRLLGDQPASSGMALVACSAATLSPLLAERARQVTVAAINSPSETVLAGPEPELTELLEALQAREIFCWWIKAKVASHSPYVDPLLPTLREQLATIEPCTPRVTFFSSVDERAETHKLDAHYWARNLRSPVHFSRAVQETLADGFPVVFVELGPHPTLVHSLAAILEGQPDDSGSRGLTVHAVLEREDCDVHALLRTTARLFAAGAIDDTPFDASGAAVVEVPGHPFARRELWPNALLTAPDRQPAAERNGPGQETEEIMTSEANETVAEVTALLAQVLECDPKGIGPAQPFLHLGADSILLTTLVRRIKHRFGVEPPLGRLFSDLSNVAALSAFVRERRKPPVPANTKDGSDRISPMASSPARTDPSERAPSEVFGPEEQATFNGSNELMLAQLRAFSDGFVGIVERQFGALASKRVPLDSGRGRGGKAVSAGPSSEGGARQRMPFVPPADLFNQTQRAYVRELVDRLSAKTRRSKQQAQEARATLCDRRDYVGFHPALKEVRYPIVRSSAHGAWIWDIDGNKYLDVTMGSGVHLFGHAPDFVQRALSEQISKGFELGARSEFAAEVASGIARLTGVERVAFYSTGTEAVMTAVRLARAKTGRSKIAVFAGAYHGHHDSVLGMPGQEGTLAMVPGVPDAAMRDLLVLSYGDPASLSVLEQHRHELAAVLVEPIQSRKPQLQPAEYLRTLRKWTEDAGVVLIFDEMVTGFRLGIGGAQAMFGVRADLVTYGKVIGGGLPIGIVAGQSDLMAGLDGGVWGFGDGSSPRYEATLGVGTFSQHPLTMAAARATMLHLSTLQPDFYEALNRRTSHLVATLNAFFEEHRLPLRMHHAGSIFGFEVRGDSDVFFASLMSHGVYIWEWRACFLSAAHGDAEVAFFIEAVKRALAELQAGGFFPGTLAIDCGDEFELFASQEPLWAAARLGPDARDAYNESLVLDLVGELDEDRLRNACTRVFARHDALKTVFDRFGRTQKVMRDLPVDYRRCDLGLHGAGPSREHIDNWIAEQTYTSFDLAEGPVSRFRVAKLGGDHHLLLVSAHHIALDGWSLSIVGEEIGREYEAPGAAHLPTPVQFSQFVRRRAATNAQVRADNEAYWCERLKGPLPALPLTSDHPRPETKTYHGSRVSWSLDAELRGKLRTFAKAQNATPFMVMLAAYLETIRREGGADEVVVGIAASGRFVDGAERVVGNCASTLPYRHRFARTDGFTQQLARVRQHLPSDLEHEDADLQRVYRQLKLSWDPGRNAVFNISFNMDPPYTPAIAGLRVTASTPPLRLAKLDLSVNVLDSGHRMLVDLDYNSDLFDAARIERFLEVFCTVLQDAIGGPPSMPSRNTELGVASRKGTSQNDTGHAGPAKFVEIFEQFAAVQPEHCALVFDGAHVSYDALNHLANGLAARLLETGDDETVGIFTTSPRDAVISVLAAHKAGRPYVFLDPSYPAQRLQLMVEDSKATIVVVSASANRHNWPSPGERVITLDETRVSANVRPAGGLSGEKPAYVIYTSGSTGRPKGVVVGQAGLPHMLRAQQKRFSLSESSRILQFASFAFDASVFEFVMALGSGATLVLGGRDELLPGRTLLTFLEAHRVTHATLPPSVLSLLPAADLPDLRVLIAAGEACPAAIVKTWATRGRRFFNAYGPTEATVWATAEECTPGESAPTIGKAVEHVSIYLLNDTLARCAPGDVGEIYLGGVGLAMGYCGKPAQTAAAFVPNPFEAGSRLYRTGDLACSLTDGQVRFIGRRDEQIKYRGFRLEPAEIEAALSTHPSVSQAVVVLCPNAQGDALLTAFVTSSQGCAIDESTLRSFLAQRLPAHMVPSRFVAVESLPLTPNGKIDRRILAQWTPKGTAATSRNGEDVLQRLAELWAALLGREHIANDDNFFALGGHSLSGVKLLAQIEAEWGVELGPRVLFGAPTLARMAQELSRARSVPASLITRTETSAVAQHASQAGGVAVPVTSGQQRMWFGNRLSVEPSLYNAPLAYELNGPFEPEFARQAFAHLLRRHESLRMSFPSRDGQPQGRISDEPHPASYQFEQLVPEISPAELEARVRTEALRPFDLGAGPLCRMHVWRLSSERHALLLLFHHSVADAWSLDVLLRELSALYSAIERRDHGSHLPEPDVQYSDWARAELSNADSAARSRQLQYWQDTLRGAPARMALPYDREADELSFAGARHPLELGRDLTHAVREFSRTLQTTPYVTLLASLYVHLSHVTGQEDLVIGSPVARRTGRRVQELVGYLSNTVAFRNRVTATGSFTDLVRSTAEVVAEGLFHQDLPFELVVDAVARRRSAAHAPVFQVLFAVQSQMTVKPAFGGVRLDSIDIQRPTTKCDLAFSLLEHADEFKGDVEFATSLFDPETVGRIARGWRLLLPELLRQPNRPLSEIGQAGDLVSHFEETVSRCEGSTAIEAGPERISFGELNAYSNRLARLLIASGVRPGTPVGIIVPAGIRMVATMIAVLKAGGCYVPLRLGEPAERLRRLIADARLEVLVVDAAFPIGGPGLHVVDLEHERQKIESQPSGNPPCLRTAESPAYQLFTSGSTGKPKRVTVPDRAVRRLVCDTNYVSIVPRDRIGQACSPTFDVSTFEIWGALLNGATIVIIDKSVVLDARLLRQFILEQKLTILFLTTALLNQVTLVCPDAFEPLDALLFGGEAADARRIRDLLTAGAPRRLIHCYGPTEATTLATAYTVREVAENARTVPIGEAISGTRLFVVDERLQLVPPGGEGELLIGGDGLAHGYADEPALTASRFIPNPFSPETGERLYVTGDRVHVRGDGKLEFLERLDDQVKLHGFRIELGEVQTALLRDERVRQACVLMQPDSRGDNRLLAYLVAARQPHAALASELRHALQQSLPDYMVPAELIVLDKLPLNENGKVDKARLREQRLVSPPSRALDASDSAPSKGAQAGASAVSETVVNAWRQVLGRDRVDAHENFFDLGGTSLKLAQVHEYLLGEHPTLRVVDLFKYPTVAALSEFLGSTRTVATGNGDAGLRDRLAAPVSTREHGVDALSNRDIAIVGMAGRFPGADSIERFWANLCGGTESIQRFGDDELRREGISEAQLADPQYVRAKGALDDIDMFDAGFFGYSPKDASAMDPQQRLFLEVAHTALEDACCDPTRFPGRVGVFAGSSHSQYVVDAALAQHGNLDAPELLQQDPFALPMRTSYKLDLKGPSVFVATACSTSLVATHMACRSLEHGECDLALVGAASIILPNKSGYLTHPDAYLAPDGKCRAFDAEARGAVGGNGVGVVVLKRLRDAQRDHNLVYAVIKGSAVNNDGANKVGFTAPSVEGQAAVISEAQRYAGVSARTVGYVEAHGTGTPVGDPIEVEALAKAFSNATQDTGFCGLGSVKTNVGHLDVTAGVCGLIKTALALHHGLIPPSLNFRTPNPKMALERTPFFVVDRLSAWPPSEGPRRAGVSSFGIGGSNAHVVLEQAPAQGKLDPYTGPLLWSLSAKGPEALAEYRAKLADTLEQDPRLVLPDAAYSLSVGRRVLPHRFAGACQGRDAAIRMLRSSASDEDRVGHATGGSAPLVYMFPGIGSQYVNMGRGLYRSRAIFRESMDRCFELFERDHALVLKPILYPENGQDHKAEARLDEPSHALPALFAFEYALVELLCALGLPPAAMIGHGVGESVAACAAGVLELKDALTLATLEGRMLDGRQDGMSVFLKSVRLRGPRIPYISSVTGDWITQDLATDPSYWESCLKKPAQFDKGLLSLCHRGPATNGILVEIGPGSALREAARTTVGGRRFLGAAGVARDRSTQREDEEVFLDGLGRLWTLGAPLDLASLWADASRSRVRMPTYPFQRQSYWFRPTTAHRSPTIHAPQPQPDATSGHSKASEDRLDSANAREVVLMKAWQETLGIATIGPNDNYFDLGGTSVSAIHMLAVLRRQGFRLTPTQVFKLQTIAKLAPAMTVLDPAGGQNHSTDHQRPSAKSTPATPIEKSYETETGVELSETELARIVDAL